MIDDIPGRRPTKILAVVLSLAVIAGWSQARTVPPPAPGTATLWGKVQLVPREGVTIPKGHLSAYESRELRGAKLVDYSQPGFVVVYLEGPPAPVGEARMMLEETRWQLRIEPAYLAMGHGGKVVFHNTTTKSHTISSPALGLLHNLGPDEELELPTAPPGPLQIHVLDEALTATVFFAPGPYSVASKRGRFMLSNVAAGPATLRAWHPRFPTPVRSLVLTADRVERLDLDIGVDRLAERPGD